MMTKQAYDSNTRGRFQNNTDSIIFFYNKSNYLSMEIHMLMPINRKRKGLKGRVSYMSIGLETG